MPNNFSYSLKGKVSLYFVNKAQYIYNIDSTFYYIVYSLGI